MFVLLLQLENWVRVIKEIKQWGSKGSRYGLDWSMEKCRMRLKLVVVVIFLFRTRVIKRSYKLNQGFAHHDGLFSELSFLESLASQASVLPLAGALYAQSHHQGLQMCPECNCHGVGEL